MVRLIILLVTTVSMMFQTAKAQCNWAQKMKQNGSNVQQLSIMDSCQNTDNFSQVHVGIRMKYSPDCIFDWKLDTNVIQSSHNFHSYSYPNYTETGSYVNIDPPNGSYTISVRLTDTVAKCDTTFTRTLVRNCSTTLSAGIISDRKRLSLYPNPAKDAIHVVGLNGSSTIRITDLAGQEIPFDRNGNTLSLPDAVNGLYLVEVETEGKVRRNKLVIQK